MYCPDCGTKCENSHHFCYKCGFRLPVITESDPIPAEKPLIAEEAVETPIEEVIEAPVEEAVPEIVPAAVEVPAPVEPVSAAPTPKKGRLWPPALVLGIMMGLGLLLYLLFPTIQPMEPDPVDGDPWFSVKDGVLSFDADLYTGGAELTIPETVDGQTVTVIGEDCFKNCTELTGVVLPSTLTEIDNRAFSGCTSLRGIYIPHGVTRIGNSAFSGCLALEAIHLPTSIEIIADRALFRCPKLVHIFYAGTYEEWKELYNGSMPNNTWIYCEDGNYPYVRK